MRCNNRIKRITDKRKTEADSHTYFIILFCEVSQDDSLNCEKSLSTHTKGSPEDIDDPFVPGDHEFED